jgi:hypothetical protein
VLGKRPSAVGTRVERHSRYVVLFPLPEGFTAQRMRPALTAAVLQPPQQLRRSLTWDHGKEMAEHLQFTIDSGVQVYFCDPRSPWQRGTNENTNGLLGQYLPRVATSASSTKPRWTPSPPSSTVALDRLSVFGHPHRHSRKRCADPLRPPTFLQQPKQMPPVPLPRGPEPVSEINVAQPQLLKGYATLGAWPIFSATPASRPATSTPTCRSMR